MAHPQKNFATPLPQSPRSNVLEWQFPKPYQNYVLTGRSRAAWHTSFVIPQLDVLLDAGLCVNKLRPRHLFITHGHNDHTLLSPAFVSRDDPPDVYVPAQMKKAFNDYILADTMMNLGGDIKAEDAEQMGMDPKRQEGKEDKDDPGRTANERAWLNTHTTHGVRDGDVLELHRVKDMSVKVFNCDHTVPCVGYVFCSTRHKLKEEFQERSGHDLKELKESGTEITYPHTVPIFAFLGDTSTSVLASDPEWLQNEISVVITECSFLIEEHREQATRTKHTIWTDLEKVIRKWPKTTFVLMHFSLRYSEEEIVGFFKEMEDCPKNIVIWADGELETSGGPKGE
ncbi:RNase Z [Emericellopsis atlantica]|uniref:RNase Z n=1 Tax=Emericellopsis atlantica TaxID=2614577 RepID=A0A9P8CR26_9HYPO|nr:RNase Z [Emericellopsis atlantica]KAG9256574.1 RNase Z [Emericellopsis atlantica]